MKHLRLYKPTLILSLLVLLLIVFGLGQQFVSSQTLNAPVLARVEVTGALNDLGVPVYAHLMGADGREYALTITTVQELNNAGLAYTFLHDPALKPKNANYLIALKRVAGAEQQAAQITPILLDDGRQIIVCVTQNQADRLARIGFEIEWMSTEPLVLEQIPALKALPLELKAVSYDAQVAEMIGKVTSTGLYNYVGNLSGVNPITIGGSTYTITTRNTNNTTWSPRATQYVYEFLQAQGLAVQYHNWSTTAGKRNVIATKTGTSAPTEIVLLTAHLDDMPSSGSAPGADDNASGSVGVMTAAEIMKQYQFERTIRFVLFTGEEQGLLGSAAYANQAYANGDNIVAVLNLDMIAWDSTGGPVLRLHTRTSSNSGYAGDKAIADLFSDVVNTYSLSSALTPTLTADGESASDHSSFWNKGYSALLAIEDDSDDFCAYYHTSNDKLSTLNMTYYTNYAKAVIGTAAHLAKPVSTTPGPTANFTYTPSSLTATFQDTSTCNTCTITAWNWNFGDGYTSTQQNPSRTYAAAGTYTVSLTVTDNSSRTSSIQKPVTVGVVPVYCTSKGSSQSYEWISKVEDGSFSNSSTASGYSDFTSKVIPMTKGTGYTVGLTPGFSGSSYTEYWRVWIDLNADGDFEDSGEKVLEKSGKSKVSASVTIPSTAITGNTRMRVSMRYSSYPSSCGTFSYGEVEDYTVQIQ
jgi:PKD repeat protein